MGDSASSQLRFVDPEDQQMFREQGFVVKPVLDAAGLELLRQTFGQLSRPASEEFYVTLVERSFEESEALSAVILSVLRPKLASILRGESIVGATFLRKSPGRRGEISLHQDWTLVDERTTCSMNLWCPLVDVDRTNGALEVLPGSHLWFPAFRSPQLPSAQIPFSFEIEPLLLPLSLSAGEAVFYDHRLFHGSRANLSDGDRVVAQVGLTPIDEDLVMCFDRGDDIVEMRHVGADALFRGMELESAASDAEFGTLRSTVVSRTIGEAEVMDRIRRELSAIGKAVSRPAYTFTRTRWRPNA